MKKIVSTQGTIILKGLNKTQIYMPYKPKKCPFCRINLRNTLYVAWVEIITFVLLKFLSSPTSSNIPIRASNHLCNIYRWRVTIKPSSAYNKAAFLNVYQSNPSGQDLYTPNCSTQCWMIEFTMMLKIIGDNGSPCVTPQDTPKAHPYYLLTFDTNL